MLLIQDIRENKEAVLAALAKRNEDFTDAINQALQLDDERKSCQKELDEILAKSNAIAKEIGQLYKEGKRDEAESKKAETAELKSASQELKEKQNQIEEDLRAILFTIPNTVNEKVPAGKSEEDNEVISSWGEPKDLSNEAIPHWELAKKYDLIDFELGVKITGAGFPVYKGKGAILQRALINFFLDEAIEAGYDEVIPPHLINEASGIGTGSLPDKEGQMYYMPADDLYLIPTAEVPVTNIYRDVILKESDFPIKNTAYTPCFRREAGSYGKDVRGLNRLHQFDKVEIVTIVHPDKSEDTLLKMVKHVTDLVEKLELPYRILRLCGGDTSFSSSHTYDIEVYSGAQNRWLEVSSISNFRTFQANRLKLRFKNADGKTQLAHTLNGSALALPRIVAAILENHQKDGKIFIPKALQKYTRFHEIS